MVEHGYEWASSVRGRRVVVTGGLGNLGRALAQVLMDAGAHVALIDHHVAEPGVVAGVSTWSGVDLEDRLATEAAMDAIADQLGGLDGLINAAGGFAWEAVADCKIATWNHLYGVNLRTALVASHAATPHLLAQGRGRIVNIGSWGALHASRGMGAYAASKAALLSLTEAMADEYKPHGITVNALLPATLDTPANRAAMPEVDPRGWLAPSDLAMAAAFLLSDAAAAINGALIPVRGQQ